MSQQPIRRAPHQPADQEDEEDQDGEVVEVEEEEEDTVEAEVEEAVADRQITTTIRRRNLKRKISKEKQPR